MIVAWPNRIKAGGDLRTQFTHCIDIGPTVLEAVGLPEPKTVDGIAQEPMDGTSFLYTLEDASAAERHTVQYFEIGGARAIYKDGWWACTRLDKAPWDLSPQTMERFAPGVYDPEQDVWELYYLPDDFSQARDLAAQNPDKLKELQELFWQEAERNRVLPLLGGFSIFFGLAHAVGDHVPSGDPLLFVYGERPLPQKSLRRALAMDDERTLVDVAIKALSPAVNDPTTAVQMLDRIEDLLRLGIGRAQASRLRDRRTASSIFANAVCLSSLRQDGVLPQSG